ncbi:uncharacterized protein LOC127103345 [Lathyrus oleraceus]|uniref:uncharacterized protein LOC127103345 n=1 Tax=Pisum sativum TaxID=3888 RepID=UPI0021D04C60|nr:uncharacterized protein LOC127103345 [Pisum sativum]
MAYTEEHKELFGTHMFSEEAEDCWDNTRQRLEVVGAEITWVVFRLKFLEKYFPKDVCSKKEIEFLELKQENMTVSEYVANCGGIKCINFENRLRPEIKQGIGYQEIHRFPTLVNKCRIYDEDCRARSTYYKNVRERKGKNQFRGKPYSSLEEKGKQRTTDEKKPSGGVTPISVKCFKCGESGHHANECKNNILGCIKCGKTSHHVMD